MTKESCCWIKSAWMIATAAICLASPPTIGGSMSARGIDTDPTPSHAMATLVCRAAAIWGPANVWIPSPKVLVQYEPDLGERSAVDFEKGLASVQILLESTDDPHRELVRAHLRQGVGNLVSREAKDPVEMISAQETAQNLQQQKGDATPASLAARELRIYLAERGDSLWGIARRFGMQTEQLAKLNGLDTDAVLPAGRPLKVAVFSSHDLTLDAAPPLPSDSSLILDQIRMADGRPVPPWLIRSFAAEVVENRMRVQKVVGGDGVERLVVSVDFELVPNHLVVRARKFYPLVQSHALKHKLDPAVIMAIIHTESVFNPRARSSTPAYGLMQLVPYSGAREAYRKIYGQKRRLTPQYLYDPQNNIELGTAYFNILKNKYMRKILNPTSRTYCAVAAYNAGAANVGQAFVHQKSINLAAAQINRLDPPQVYARLVDGLPFLESRNYVRKVLERVSLYQEW